MTTAKDVINFAQQEIGYVEIPNNRTKYGSWYGMNGEPWCAMFVSYCFYFSELLLPIDQEKPGFAYCPYGVDWFKQQGRFFNDPQPGDVVFFCFRGDGIAEHVGIVQSVNADGTVSTIEGNTSPTDYSNGGEVMRQTREREVIIGFGRPNYDGKVVFPQGVSPKWTGRYIKFRDNGEEVMLFQRRLIKLGYPLNNNGVFDEQSVKALKKFQQEHGLEVDGIVGAESWYKAWKLPEPALV